ncbi:MAG: hypothetical protein Q9188_002204 [Gyalolechia gomerana]
MSLTTTNQNVTLPPGIQDNLPQENVIEVAAKDRSGTPVDEGLARAHHSRDHPSWSSPLPDAASAELKFTASGEYLEFLSLILTKPRQVDIGFPKRHALIVFLMENLEITFWKYAKRMIPEELEALQILSPDEFEPQVWAAFLSVHVPHEKGQGWGVGIDSMTSIRNIAVHRWDYDTSTIRAAAAQAFRLSDDTLLQKLELILKVLCKLGEESSYEFCKRHLPQALVHYKAAVAEQIELGWWHKIIETQQDCMPTDAQERDFAAQISEKVQKTWPRSLRNAAAHREMIYINENGGHGLERLTDPVAKYVRILGHEERATTIEELTAETKALLLKKYEEWTDPAWCHTRDWKLIRDTIKRRITQWESRLHPFFEKGVCITPIIQMYNRSDDRMYILIRENGWLMDSSPKLHYYDVPRPPVERESADEADANDDSGNQEGPTGSESPPGNGDDEWIASDGNAESGTSTADDDWGANPGGDNQTDLYATPWADSEHQSQANQDGTGEIGATGSGSWMSSSHTDRATDKGVVW